ncbi:hypothetical protein QUF80_14795 [Desulfococcaceae bacterium HSG8]|nr:hypothetical protein [Desulfococcaceae bacterium HSG8]
MPIRTEQQGLSERFYYDARGGLANPPHLTWFGFVNPNRATEAKLALRLPGIPAKQALHSAF